MLVVGIRNHKKDIFWGGKYQMLHSLLKKWLVLYQNNLTNENTAFTSAFRAIIFTEERICYYKDFHMKKKTDFIHLLLVKKKIKKECVLFNKFFYLEF